jgi:transmembrane sensor
VKTTLLEGSVRVVKRETGKENQVMLKPGEQAVLLRNSRLTIDHSPDIDKVMAWKNGVFNFEGATFRDIMDELERWYDVEIVYEKTVPDIEFEGKMTRDVPLIDLLKMLERSDIHYRKEGRKLTILP